MTMSIIYKDFLTTARSIVSWEKGIGIFLPLLSWKIFMFILTLEGNFSHRFINWKHKANVKKTVSETIKVSMKRHHVKTPPCKLVLLH